MHSEPRTFVVTRSPANPRHDVPGTDDYPWYVQETTHGDDRDDYGRMATWAEAMGLVEHMLKD